MVGAAIIKLNSNLAAASQGAGPWWREAQQLSQSGFHILASAKPSNCSVSLAASAAV